MAATAEVIDLGEVRRRRRLEQARPAAAPPQVVPFGWLPVLFFIPVWISTISPELLRAQA